jgi:hypothetical protein
MLQQPLLSTEDDGNESLLMPTTSTPTTDQPIQTVQGAEGVGEVLKRLVLPIYIPSVFFGLAGGMIMPYIPLVARAIGCSERMVGVVSSARFAGKVVGRC